MARNREVKAVGEICDTVTFCLDAYEYEDEEGEGSIAKVAKGNRERRRSENVDDHGAGLAQIPGLWIMSTHSQ
ncbi:hypothetical protein FNV43_RR02545 [Rhamnella rubrinervis]|uniref:Uncharacterized protein n=1 Tax=Rhamnella rubrinervis TaxID=2594499 RepID=A0A8K0HSC9_9ROSA|nr:hypothetical protein FNV43_RR02545 [Rhamnella rubrinervis]